jgi:plastocyanin domain-containing protein
VSAATSAGGVQEIDIRIDGGYSPATIRVKRGTPVRLIFDRQERSSCSEEVVFGDFGIRRFLPAFQKTAVELTPKDEGTYEFTCGMGMMKGKIVVEGEREGSRS